MGLLHSPITNTRNVHNVSRHTIDKNQENRNTDFFCGIKISYTLISGVSSQEGRTHVSLAADEDRLGFHGGSLRGRSQGAGPLR